MGAAVGFHDVATGRDAVPIAATTAANALALGPNEGSTRGKKLPARAIVYNGTITVTTVGGSTRALIDQGGYARLDVAIEAVAADGANPYMLIY